MTEQTNDAATWHWTNDDHTEARNGRWAVTVKSDTRVVVGHDDFQRTWTYSTLSESWNEIPVTWNPAADFLTWRAEQDVPEEPAGICAVKKPGGWQVAVKVGTGWRLLWPTGILKSDTNTTWPEFAAWAHEFGYAISTSPEHIAEAAS